MANIFCTVNNQKFETKLYLLLNVCYKVLKTFLTLEIEKFQRFENKFQNKHWYLDKAKIVL